MSQRYEPKEIEKKWQQKWYDVNLYSAQDLDEKREKKYILVEFPYPSAAALHVGHAFRFTVPDVYSRYLRMKGYNVLFPIGYDAFGLPTEERARKEGKNPVETTKENIEIFRGQLRRLGYSFDWDREVATTDPDYYKWTQWIFGEMYKAGLVVQKEVELWWCPALATVLANEEVLDDPHNIGAKISERGEHPVERKVMTQWVIKITEYAEKLLDGLDLVDWPEHIKDMQRNWIGKSEGADIVWSLDTDSDRTITTFTTRIDTLPAVSFLALAPEYKGLYSLVTDSEKSAVTKYLEEVKNKSDRERLVAKEKTGVFTGSYARNPLTGELVPLWVADYVLAGYGAGAVMGVAGHDERDFEFADKMGLAIKYNVGEVPAERKPTLAQGVLHDSGEFDGLTTEEAKVKIITALSEKGLAKSKTHYKLRDWVFSRQRYWGEPFPFEYRKIKGADIDNGDTVVIEDESYEIRVLSLHELPLLLPAVDDYLPANDGQSPLAKTEWAVTKDNEGSIISRRETDTMPNWAGSCWYFLRYIDPKNSCEFASKDKLQYWLPVDIYFGGSEHTTLHLLYSRMWYRFLYDQGLVPNPEPYQKRINGGILLGADGRKMSKSLGNGITPDEKIEAYGADALRLYINFIGPYDATVVWQEGGLKACKALLDKVWQMQEKVTNVIESRPLESLRHKSIQAITENVEQLKTNVCVAQLMTFANALKECEKIPLVTWVDFVKLLAIFAPHISEELWNRLQKSTSIHLDAWPVFDPQKAVSDSVTIAVQVNGKVRAEIIVLTNTPEEEIFKLAQQSVEKWIQGKTIRFSKLIGLKLVTFAVTE